MFKSLLLRSNSSPIKMEALVMAMIGMSIL